MSYYKSAWAVLVKLLEGGAYEVLGGTQTGSHQTGSYQKGRFIPPKPKLVCLVFWLYTLLVVLLLSSIYYIPLSIIVVWYDPVCMPLNHLDLRLCICHQWYDMCSRSSGLAAHCRSHDTLHPVYPSKTKINIHIYIYIYIYIVLSLLILSIKKLL